jgi:AcrR family transcriptional regulator
MSAEHRLRADAARNRESILGAARTLFAAQGASVGMDEIAREAGLAVGTLYRHFPTKQDLLNAIAAELADRIFGALDETVARIDAGGDAMRELTVLTERVSVAAGEDRTIKAAMSRLGLEASPEQQHRAVSGLARIVEAGHAQGAFHPDVTPADLIAMMHTLPGDDLPEPARRRWVQLMLRGLAAPEVTD